MTTRRRRVLVLTSTWPRWPGDSTTAFVPDLTHRLVERGWEAEVLAPHAEGAGTREVDDGIAVRRYRYAVPASAETVCYDGGALVNLRSRRREMLKLPGLVAAQGAVAARMMAGGAFDLVHAHWLLPQGFVGALAGGRRRPPMVVTVHGGDVFALKAAPFRAAKRVALRRAAAVTVNSSATRAVVADLGASSARTHTIPMGVDVDTLLTVADPPGGQGPTRVAFVGRVVAEKGVFDLVDAVVRLRAAGTDIDLTVVGDGPDLAAVRARAEQGGIDEHTEFTGWVDPDAVPEHLAAAHIVAAPSRTSSQGWVEAQGLVIVEAMAAGRPVVATDSGGIGDAVTDAETGRLVPEADVTALAAAIGDLAADADQRRRFGAAARARVRERYAGDVVADRFAALFDEVVAHAA